MGEKFVEVVTRTPDQPNIQEHSSSFKTFHETYLVLADPNRSNLIGNATQIGAWTKFIVTSLPLTTKRTMAMWTPFRSHDTEEFQWRFRSRFSRLLCWSWGLGFV